MKKMLCTVLILTIFSGFMFAQESDSSDSSISENSPSITEKVVPPPHFSSDDKAEKNPLPPPDATPSKPSKSNLPKRRTPPPPPKQTYHGYSLFELFLDLFFTMSLLNNWSISFDYYPYATSDYYIDALSAGDTSEFPQKDFRFNIEAAAIYHPNSMILSPEVRFEGYIFKFFGPIFENKNYFTFGEQQFYKGNLRLGGQIAVIQSFIFSMGVSCQWSYYYGAPAGFKNLSAVNWGIIFKSYPFKPIVLEYRINITDLLGQSPIKDIICDPNTMFESHLELGIMLNSPFEIYTAWRYYQDGLRQKKEHTVDVGVKYYF